MTRTSKIFAVLALFGLLLSGGLGTALVLSSRARARDNVRQESTSEACELPHSTGAAAPVAAATTTNTAAHTATEPTPAEERTEHTEQRPAPRPAPTSEGIRVRRLIVATGVSHREPTGAAERFEVGAQERIYAFVDARNEQEEAIALEVRFVPESGAATGQVELSVPASARRYRTWAFTRGVRRAGTWRAEVLGPDGQVLRSAPFEVVEAGASDDLSGDLSHDLSDEGDTGAELEGGLALGGAVGGMPRLGPV